MDLNIAVITVCLNCEDEIEKTIESVYQQEQCNYEYIIQDGMSHDNTLKKIEKYRHKFAERNISFIVESQRDKGIYYAMNLAASKCKAKYLLFLNAGDVLCHKKVFNVLNAACDNSEADVYYGDALMIDKSGMRLFRADMQLINRRMPFSHQSCFILRKQFLNYQYNLNYAICADYDLILNLFEEKCNFEYLNTIVCKYEMNGVSSRSYIKKRKEHEKILKEHQLNSSSVKSCIYIFEAYIKSILDIILPSRVLCIFRRFYMDKIKHYEYWGGKIY